MHSTKFIAFAIIALFLIAPDHAIAHAGESHGGGFWDGVTHPVLGLDHLVAMVAVGLWGAFLGAPAIWMLPIIFPMVMAVGAIFGLSGGNLPYMEWVIALSGVVLGLLILARTKLPLAAAGILVGIFALFHGFAHGAELPQSANPAAFIIGFVIATGLLHVAGIVLGTLTRWPSGILMVRGLGAIIACVGIFFAAQII